MCGGQAFVQKLPAHDEHLVYGQEIDGGVRHFFAWGVGRERQKR